MMNERIRELREQCSTVPGFDFEKFAELLVQECINICLEQKKWVENQTIFNEADAFWNKARIAQSQHIVDKIKKYFGVE